MRKVVIDTNVVFSALLSESSQIREMLSREDIYFCAPNYLMVEVFKHKERIVEKSNVTEEIIYELLGEIMLEIDFINEDAITIRNYMRAFQLCKDVDENDTPFLALALEFDAEFWTRDKALKIGLEHKGFNNFFDENILT